MGQLWEDPKRSRHCVNPEYVGNTRCIPSDAYTVPRYLQRHPPLLILSLDGLVSPLSEHFDSLKKLGDLGVSTTAVYSSIPESNFTNSIAIATGMYPRWQGWLEGSPRGNEANMTNADDIKPIWQRYSEQTKGIAALHSWPLGPFQAYRPDYYVASNEATLLEDQLTAALRWLRMEATLRPGLVMIKSDEVRKILETAESAAVAQRLLSELNGVLVKFFAELFREGILECMNIVILSDEGVTRSAWSLERIDKSDYDEADPEKTIANVYGTNPFGEFSFSNDKFNELEVESEHSEHRVHEFVANLLNMTHVRNNGTIGLMDDILVHPVKRERHIKFGIRECPYTNENTVINCGGCTAIQQTRIAKWMSSCVQPNRPLVLLSSSSTFCYKKICEKLIVKGSIGDDSLALVEVFHPNNAIAKSETACRFVSSRYGAECSDLTASEGHEFRSLSANPKKSKIVSYSSLVVTKPFISVLARDATIQVLWKSSFITAILDPLNEYTLTTSKDIGRLICITGTAYDRDLDGIADRDRR
ncbi:unnamed protein product [Cylicocyclus nassatus]|uniref:Uncharacterized protein n=1 Tax=Cylicocyclus nassatus TaxID=53992 RepID=A0AA36GJE6_CYLNA|nr:unnamed protein product [Cylicocyclus nassatus]